MATGIVCPGLPPDGLTPEIVGEGFTTRADVLLLAKDVPVAVVPEIETVYVVGEATTMAAGIWKVTRRTVPEMVATEVADAVTPAGCRFTVTSAGGIVPDGNPEPVTLTLVNPACPAVGDTEELSVTRTGTPAGCIGKTKNKSKTPRRRAGIGRYEMCFIV